MNAVVTTDKTHIYKKEAFRDTRSGYWSKASKDKFVVIPFYKSGGYFTSSVNKCNSKASAEKKAAEYGYSYTVYILQSEEYNKLIDYINNNYYDISFEVNMQALTHQENKEFQDQPVFVVWNMTKAQFVVAKPSEEDALKAAQGFARSAPTHEFLVLAPKKKVYQPANVTTEDL